MLADAARMKSASQSGLLDDEDGDGDDDGDGAAAAAVLLRLRLLPPPPLPVAAAPLRDLLPFFPMVAKKKRNTSQVMATLSRLPNKSTE